MDGFRISYLCSGSTPNSDLQPKEKLPHHDANLLQIYQRFKAHMGKTFTLLNVAVMLYHKLYNGNKM